MPAGFEIFLLCLPLAAAAEWAAGRVGVPFPVLLVAVGALLGLAPWVHAPVLSPEIVFYVFLPPLLYYAGFFMPLADLRANARPIGMLAVGLVVVTTAAVAAVVTALAPAVPPAVAIVAGAVVAPTDPVAATSVFRRLGAPERLATIAEGEGLVNDGAALVLYAGAVGATVAGTVGPGRIAMSLVVAPLGGTALGLLVAWVMVAVRRRLHQPLVEITLSLATPYLTYALAEGVGLSGILATVAAGVFVGSRSGSIFVADVRLQAFAFLDVLVFLLNAVLFTLVGIQLVRVVHEVPGMPAAQVAAAAVLAAIVVVGVRLAWMLAGPAVRRASGAGDRPDLAWKPRILLGWAGMRGGVSLAAALAVPLRRADGTPFPYRDLVVVLAAAVILGTLLLQGMTLPWLMRRLGFAGEEHRDEERLARLHAARAALARLDRQAQVGGADEFVDALRARYAARVRHLQSGGTAGPREHPEEPDELERYRALRLELIGLERAAVASLRQEGRIGAAVLRAVERDLDLEETRIRRW